jgi:sec-independent protein translocase protein TatA
LIFGTKKLRNMGSDLGGAVKGFKEGMKTADDDKPAGRLDAGGAAQTFEGEVKDKTKT